MHIILIVFSIIVSVVLSISVDLSKLELGALANIFFPPVIGIITIGIYVFVILTTKETSIILLKVLCLINLLVGVLFHFFNF